MNKLTGGEIALILIGVVALSFLLGYGLCRFLAWHDKKPSKQIGLCPYCDKITGRWIFSACQCCGKTFDVGGIPWINEDDLERKLAKAKEAAQGKPVADAELLRIVKEFMGEKK